MGAEAALNTPGTCTTRRSPAPACPSPRRSPGRLPRRISPAPAGRPGAPTRTPRCTAPGTCPRRARGWQGRRRRRTRSTRTKRSTRTQRSTTTRQVPSSRRGPTPWHHPAMTTAPASYAHGTSLTPLHGETIGENLRRTVERHGDREALVVRSQGYRATYRALWDETTRAALGLLAYGVQKGDRVGIWAPNRFEWVVIQHATARLGAILVNINPAYKTSELEYALRQSGVSVLLLARAFRSFRLHRDARRGAPARAEPARGARHRRRLARAHGGRVAREPPRARGPRAVPRLRRPHQHPVHVRHDGLPQGRDALAPQHPQQRVLRRPAPPLHRRGPHLRAGPVLPLLRHGHGQPRRREPRRLCRRPRRGLRAPRGARGRAGRALHLPLRRPHHVHRPARAPPLRRLRPALAPHRDHGRLALPGGDHEGGAGAHEHAGGHHLLRDDRDLAGLDAERARRPARQAGRHGGPRPPARGGEDCRPRHRAGRAPPRHRRASARGATA